MKTSDYECPECYRVFSVSLQGLEMHQHIERALAEEGIHSLGDLLMHCTDDLVALPHLTGDDVAEIRDHLEGYGYHLADEHPAGNELDEHLLEWHRIQVSERLACVESGLARHLEVLGFFISQLANNSDPLLHAMRHLEEAERALAGLRTELDRIYEASNGRERG